MATDVGKEENILSTNSDVYTCVEQVTQNDQEPPTLYRSLSVEEYKRQHNIGSRSSTENIVTYKESAFHQSPDHPRSVTSPGKSQTNQLISDPSNDLTSLNLDKSQVKQLCPNPSQNVTSTSVSPRKPQVNQLHPDQSARTNTASDIEEKTNSQSHKHDKPSNTKQSVSPSKSLLSVSPGKSLLSVSPGKSLLSVSPSKSLLSVSPNKSQQHFKSNESSCSIVYDSPGKYQEITVFDSSKSERCFICSSFANIKQDDNELGKKTDVGNQKIKIKKDELVSRNEECMKNITGHQYVTSPVEGKSLKSATNFHCDNQTKKVTQKQEKIDEKKVLKSSKSLEKLGKSSGQENAKKITKNKKVPEKLPMPGRRIRREASLNAMAMVNILFEKETSAPKSPKKQKISSPIEKSKKQESSEIPKFPLKKVNKLEHKKEKKSSFTALRSLKRKQKKDDEKVPKASSVKQKLLKLKVKKKLNNSRKRKCNEDPDNSYQKFKTKRLDTKKAARTHATVVPKRKRCFSGSTCMTCFQPLSCQHQNAMLWNSPDHHGDNHTAHKSMSNSDVDDIKPCINVDLNNKTYAIPRVQHIENPTFVSSVVPTMSGLRCHQCSQAAGILPTPCQTYTLGTMGSLNPMNIPAVLPYPQPFGGSYQLSYTGPSSLSHCGCPSCLYYTQTNTSISHQSLPPHEPCLLARPSLNIQCMEDRHIDDLGSKNEDDIIDVGTEDFLQDSEKSPVPVSKEKKKKNSPQKTKDKSKTNTVEKVKYKLKNDKEMNVQRKRALSDSSLKTLKSPKTPKERRKSTACKTAKNKIQRTISLHGWKLHGQLEKQKVYCHSIGSSLETQCYEAIKHSDGDVIRVRDCVLLRSGPRKNDMPYVAKVTLFWRHPNDGEVMMSLLWYYHPEHTEGGRKLQHATCELFASKHKDENSVACIDDKGYVLTYNEYCRFRADRRRKETDQIERSMVMPPVEYPRSDKLPPDHADSNTVFLCRQVYDFKLKRILKNPS